MNVCVFCSANQQIDPDFFSMTAELGAWLADNHHTLVYGGVNQGLMECVARAAHEHGGTTIGVIPRIVEESGRVSSHTVVDIPCENLHDRKELMEIRSDVFIALPGGLGTLDEIFSIVSGATIGYHAKRVILYNMKGFWNPLIALLDSLERQGLTREPWRHHIQTADNLVEISMMIEG